ncbi:hypothetical protein L1887_55294 [Cichorium endivia]|nr:hypothetical protein L1887_55294 [Cichorium endivia]
MSRGSGRCDVRCDDGGWERSDSAPSDHMDGCAATAVGQAENKLASATAAAAGRRAGDGAVQLHLCRAADGLQMGGGPRNCNQKKARQRVCDSIARLVGNSEAVEP